MPPVASSPFPPLPAVQPAERSVPVSAGVTRSGLHPPLSLHLACHSAELVKALPDPPSNLRLQVLCTCRRSYLSHVRLNKLLVQTKQVFLLFPYYSVWWPCLLESHRIDGDTELYISWFSQVSLGYEVSKTRISQNHCKTCRRGAPYLGETTTQGTGTLELLTPLGAIAANFVGF